MVLVVRKSGTSLRAIVREIIGKLPVDQQRSFLDTFNAAGDGTSTPEGRRRDLLHHLGQAIREDTPASSTDELGEALIETLPNLFSRSVHAAGALPPRWESGCRDRRSHLRAVSGRRPTRPTSALHHGRLESSAGETI